MALSDWIGTLGVTLLLIAFALNIAKKITPESTSYLILNIIGAGLAGVSSYMIQFYPFVVLESVWVFASILALIKINKK
ncbi:MAG: hypothetical protein WCH21_08775 [Bacteroidota bacterium]